MSRSSPSRELPSHLGSTGDQLVQITASMNHHLTDLLAILQEREIERDVLKKELSKYQDQIRGYLRSDSSRSFPSPVPTSRPHSFISVESDQMDLESDPRPHSLLSLESDTPDCPNSDEDLSEDLQGPSQPFPETLDACSGPLHPDPDLTPTEERAVDPEEEVPPAPLRRGWDPADQVSQVNPVINFALPFLRVNPAF